MEKLIDKLYIDWSEAQTQEHKNTAYYALIGALLAYCEHYPQKSKKNTTEWFWMIESARTYKRMWL